MPGCVECESQTCFGAVPRMQLYEAIQDASDRLDRAHAALLCLSWVDHLESWLEDNLWLEFRMDGFDGLSQIPKFPKASKAWVEWPVSDDTVKSKRFGTGFSTTRSRPAQYCPRPGGGPLAESFRAVLTTATSRNCTWQVWPALRNNSPEVPPLLLVLHGRYRLLLLQR